MSASLDPNIARLLWSTARSRGRYPAVVENDRETSYTAVLLRAAAIATALVAAGLCADDRVAIWLDGGVDAIAAFFGVAAAGGIALIVNESFRPRQVEYMLNDSTATVLLTSGDLLTRQPRPLETKCRTLTVEQIPAVGDFQPMRRVGADPVQIVYTSGSTGLPKGVTVSHANLSASTEVVASYLGITPQDRIASVLPFSFVYGMSQLLCAIGTGATLVIERSPLPQELVARLGALGVTVLAAVPPLWLQLLNVRAFQAAPLPCLRVMTNAGGHLPVSAVRALRRAQPQARLFLMYGLTEVLRSTYLPPEEVDHRPDSIGRPIPGADVLVLRDDLSPCEPGEVGELVHRGPTVTLGYWNDQEATARVFRPYPLRAIGVPDAERVVFSGDLVRRDEQGFLYYVGRRDRMIKTLGYRVSPDEIANVLYASGEIVECVVTAEPDERRGQRIVAYLVLAPGGSVGRLKKHCGVELPPYMQPARCEVRESLPRLPNGKHDLAAIHESRDLA